MFPWGSRHYITLELCKFYYKMKLKFSIFKISGLSVGPKDWHVGPIQKASTQGQPVGE